MLCRQSFPGKWDRFVTFFNKKCQERGSKRGRAQEGTQRKRSFPNFPKKKAEMEEQSNRPARVKDKTPASVQITAEQILREAQNRQDGFRRAPRQRILDHEELQAFQGTKRKQFEETVRKDRTNIGSWIKYAAWEETQSELERYEFQKKTQSQGQIHL